MLPFHGELKFLNKPRILHENKPVDCSSVLHLLRLTVLYASVTQLVYIVHTRRNDIIGIGFATQRQQLGIILCLEKRTNWNGAS